MLNRDFLKRLVFRFGHGHGGWLPWYNFYTGGINPDIGQQNASQLVFADTRPSLDLGHGDPKSFSNTFAPNGAANLPDLHDDVTDAAEHVRFVRSSKSAADVSGGVKQALALQNYYMGYASSGSDPEGLQLQTRIPLAAVPLDPDVLVDPVPGPFNNPAVVSMYMDPDLVPGPGTKLTSQVVDILRLRLTHGDLNGSLSWTSARETAFPLNPYLDTLDNNYTTSEFAIPFIVSSDLDFDPTRPPLRFIGFQYGDMLSYTPSSVTADLLKLRLSSDPMHEAFLNPNCVMLALHTSRYWYKPVACVLQGGASPVTRISGLYESLWNRPSFNVLGFTPSAAPIAITAAARPRIKYKTVVSIDRPGTTARGLYSIERYAGSVIEHTLTNHLPATDSFGNPSRYFTEKATFVHDSETTKRYTDTYGCLQPVAFPAGQLPDDPWIWFVSMDDDYKFWLNKQEIGKANAAACVSELDAPPLQLVVASDAVYLLHGSEIRIWKISTGTWTSLKCRAELPDTVLRAIAIDREQNRVWIGHKSGVFELLASGAVSELNVASLPVDAKSVSKLGLVAVNGYVAWSTNSTFSPKGDYERLTASYIVRVTTSTPAVQYWTNDDVCYASTDNSYEYVSGKQIGRVGLRSNGELLIAHMDPWSSASRGFAAVSLSWFKVNQDGTLYRRHWCSKFGLRGPALTFPDINSADEHMVYMPPIHRIDDFHYVTGQIPFRYPSPSYPEKDIFTFDMTQYGPHLSPEGQSQVNEFRLDEDANWIYLHPCAYTGNNDRYTNMGPQQFSDMVNFPGAQDSLIPPHSLTTRGSEFEFVLYSFCPIRIDGCYALLMAGNQMMLPMGIELDWTGTAWTHRLAGQPRRAKTIHADSQPAGPHFNIAFDVGGAGHVFNKSTCFRVDVQPGTSLPVPESSLYLGEYFVVTENVVPGPDGTAVVSKAGLGMFCGIDTANNSDISARVGVSPLVRVESNPGPGQFSVDRNGTFVFAASLSGTTVNVTYNYVMQAG